MQPQKLFLFLLRRHCACRQNLLNFSVNQITTSQGMNQRQSLAMIQKSAEVAKEFHSHTKGLKSIVTSGYKLGHSQSRHFQRIRQRSGQVIIGTLKVKVLFPTLSPIFQSLVWTITTPEQTVTPNKFCPAFSCFSCFHPFYCQSTSTLINLEKSRNLDWNFGLQVCWFFLCSSSWILTLIVSNNSSSSEEESMKTITKAF